jgi:hypothetical protein
VAPPSTEDYRKSQYRFERYFQLIILLLIILTVVVLLLFDLYAENRFPATVNGQSTKPLELTITKLLLPLLLPAFTFVLGSEAIKRQR